MLALPVVHALLGKQTDRWTALHKDASKTPAPLADRNWDSLMQRAWLGYDAPSGEQIPDRTLHLCRRRGKNEEWWCTQFGPLPVSPCSTMWHLDISQRTAGHV
ncbi:unnamed protein product [Ectocarpus fasciculatus]